MRFTETSIPGVQLIELEPHGDARGFFARVWCEREVAEHQGTGRCVQANLSVTPERGTLRGMHFQLPPHAETKVVRVIRGAIFDVALDLRGDSPTRGQWFGCELNADHRRSLLIPEGCAHGFLTLTDHVEVLYLVSAFYAPQAERGVHWNCPELAGAWPSNPVRTSVKDENWPRHLPDFPPEWNWKETRSAS